MEDHERGRDGFALREGVLSTAEVDAILDAIAEAQQRPGRPHAIRNLFDEVPAIRSLARAGPVRSLVEPTLGPGCFAVRGLFFDKTPTANWKVPWHQDLTITVRERADRPGFGPWSEKAGIAHVRPPVEILERMVAVRIHLDDCRAGNGPLQVIPGSHRGGRLDPEAGPRWTGWDRAVACAIGRGGALLMRPLLLHASSAATEPGHRRVIHLEYAADELPAGLRWRDRW